MQMVVDGDSSFHTGWLARFLGLPRFLPGAGAMKDGDVKAFGDGWDMAEETLAGALNPIVLGNVYAAFTAMRSVRQAYTGWIDDAGEDVKLPEVV
jgi:hypothetical protein